MRTIGRNSHTHLLSATRHGHQATVDVLHRVPTLIPTQMLTFILARFSHLFDLLLCLDLGG